MTKKTIAKKSLRTLTAADLRMTKLTGGALSPTPIIPKNDWTRTGYGEDGFVLSWDPRDCD